MHAIYDVNLVGCKIMVLKNMLKGLSV